MLAQANEINFITYIILIYIIKVLSHTYNTLSIGLLVIYPYNIYIYNNSTMLVSDLAAASEYSITI